MMGYPSPTNSTRSFPEWAFYLTVTLLFLASLHAALFLLPSSNAQLENPIGSMQSKRGLRRHGVSLDWSDAKTNAQLYVHDVIYAPPGAPLKLKMKDKSVLELQPGTLIELEEPEYDSSSFRLLQGQVKESDPEETPSKTPHPVRHAVKALRPKQSWAEDIERVVASAPEAKIEIKPVPQPVPQPEPQINAPAAAKVEVQPLPAPATAPAPIKLTTIADAPPEFEKDLSALKAKTKEVEGGFKTLDKVANVSKDLHNNLDELRYYDLRPLRPANDESVGTEWMEFAWTPVPVKSLEYEVEMSRSANFSNVIKYRTTKNQIKIQFETPSLFYWRVKALVNGQQLVSTTRQIKVLVRPGANADE